jgi:hypothetical protein
MVLEPLVAVSLTRYGVDGKKRTKPQEAYNRFWLMDRQDL